jgi:predicted alpha/beta superfamily hydrolase
MSPSFWFGDFKMYDWTKQRSAPPMKVYIDVGTAEEGESPSGTDEFVTDTQAMGGLLKEQGHSVCVVVAPGANHSEASWKKRFPGVLEWFLTP